MTTSEIKVKFVERGRWIVNGTELNTPDAITLITGIMNSTDEEAKVR